MWKQVNINKQNVEHETIRAFLIKCPNNSEYNKYKFWHPTKLVRSGRNKNALQLSYTDEFVFKLKKYASKTNEVIDEIEINVQEFEEMFEVTDSNIRSKKEESFLEITEPKKIEIEKVEIKECLKNN